MSSEEGRTGLRRIPTARGVSGLSRDGRFVALPWTGGPPPRFDGFTLGIVDLDPEQPEPHGGERHPDGDEILYLISGRIRVCMDDAPGAVLELGPGEGCVVPAGAWHRIETLEVTKLVHLTPGPRGEHRPPP
jgi:quercetin dioxygenase-like cupin family protein